MVSTRWGVYPRFPSWQVWMTSPSWMRTRSPSESPRKHHEHHARRVRQRKLHTELTHVPFPSWCWYCVQRKAEEHAHRKIDEAHLEDLHQIRFVYAFAKTDDDVDMLKFSTIRWRQTGGTATFYVRQRGPGDEYVL